MLIRLVCLLFLVQRVSADRKIAECKDWACFAPRVCLGIDEPELKNFDRAEKVTDDCPGILMIRPYSAKKWAIRLESWNAAASSVKISQGSNELMKCEKVGGKSTPTSSLVGFKVTPAASSDSPLLCEFSVGDGVKEVLADKTNDLNMAAAALTVNVVLRIFNSGINGKVTCNPLNIQFEPSSDEDALVEEVQSSLDEANCARPEYTLQFKDGASYADVADGRMRCEGTTTSPSDYKFDFALAGGTKKSAAGPFTARCYAKVCGLCPPLSSQTPAGKVAPTLTAEGPCKSLKCDKFFKLSGVVTAGEAVCKRGLGGAPQWHVGSTPVEPAAAIECVDTMPCTVVGCSGDCTVNSKSHAPQCSGKQILSVTVDGKETREVSVECDGSRGVLTYLGADGITTDLPGTGVLYSCSAPAPVTTQPPPAPSMKPALKGFLGVAICLSFLLVVGAIASLIWKQHRKKKQAAAAAAPAEQQQPSSS